MDQSHRSLPRDVFVHLLMIAMLYAAVVSFLALLFQYINAAFPDALGTYYPSILDTIRRSEATLLIVFPVYLFLSWFIGRDIDRVPALREFFLVHGSAYPAIRCHALARYVKRRHLQPRPPVRQ